MLTHLSISHFAIVDQLDLDIPRGMSVITGETGAGKSIMLDALSLTLGSRADSDCVRTGCERADIRATFDINSLPEALQWLKARDLEADNECILRRVITKDGRSRGYINGTPSPLSDLRQLGQFLIDIHAQHEHQSLLRPSTHLKLLDEYAGNQKLSTQVREGWQKWRQLQDRIVSLQTQSKDQDARIQLLQYQNEELDRLSISEGEVEALEQEQKQLSNAEASLYTYQQVVNLCSESDNGNILHSLTLCQQLLAELGSDIPQLQDTQDMLATAQIQVEEATGELNRFVDNFEADPARLAEITERLSTVYTLARKHHVAPEELHQFHAELQQELESMQCSDEIIEELETELDSIQKQYQTLATKLSDKRRKSANRLNKAVSKHIHELGMPAGQFIVDINPLSGEPQALGMEEVRFLVSTNPGTPPRPMDKVASGGELSRISLAIQVITAKTSGISTLVFDEVDVGIGGGTAEIVGRLLRELGDQGQVLCVTHQPQVASQGHTHLHVSKKLRKDSTRTHINTLQGEDRTKEVARMLGGVEMTEQTLAHAREMISLSSPAQEAVH
ncbi:DNA repair protein RecN [Sansalvadorimonas sp. 2012CJ34-2]|uniref:DNA repair protein RecN n=1 Tax=Parendozoicomonas callyspongiae TaxID=2942213 RepID=A0ABT0PF63_9GAMM|nr:DNA repair protein RecN [Sansalvadorimonas sp. 2012CJ34-2]MCL6270000.1 DNA repair protein RecN [Sansalvadorimonas sp. 2012CJ34-2]